MNGGAFGAGKAGGAFDPIQYVMRPAVILRALCWLFAVVVFGCICSEGWIEDECLYNGDSNACNFGTGIGVIAFLAAIAFLILEAMFENISSIKVRRRAVMADLGFSAFWSFMWFVSFCYLADQWRKAPYPEESFGLNNCRAAIAFSLFSIFVWAGCAFFAFQRYKQGGDQAFAPSYDQDPGMVPGGTPYTAYPGGPEGDQQYQEQPFSGGNQEKIPTGMSNFQAPAY